MILTKHASLYLSFALLSVLLFILTFLLKTDSKETDSVKNGRNHSLNLTYTYSKIKPFVFSERTRHYHNTLIVDILQPEDFQSDYSLKSKVNFTLKDFIRTRIIQAERRWETGRREYEQKLKHIKPSISEFKNIESPVPSWIINHPLFTCPHVQENIAGQCLCGLELYRERPRPQESTVYIICGEHCEHEKIERLTNELLQETDNNILIFFTEPSPSFSKVSSRVEVFSSVELYKEGNKTSKTLRLLLKETGHGWLDFLFLFLNEKELKLVWDILGEYKDQVLPFGQLVIHAVFEELGHTEAALKRQNQTFSQYFIVFNKLFEKGLRPTCREMGLADEKIPQIIGKGLPVIVKYSFINLRGNHLILLGSE